MAQWIGHINEHSAPLPLYRFDLLSAHPEIVHAVTPRHGGTSQSPYDSLNLSFDVGDDPDAVRANRKTLAAALGVDAAEFVAADQPHGTNVAVVRTADRGRGALDPATGFTDVDALVTRERGAMLLCFSADCPSIVLFDPARRVVAAAHSGWRGTVGGIAWKAIRRMQEEFACRADDLLACIGPGIAPCCFEVGSDVVLAVEQRMPLAKEFITLRDGRTYFDIASTIRKQVLEAGVAASRIESANVCTFCRVDEFFSYRAESGRTGRFATVVGLR